MSLVVDSTLVNGRAARVELGLRSGRVHARRFSEFDPAFATSLGTSFTLEFGSACVRLADRTLPGPTVHCRATVTWRADELRSGPVGGRAQSLVEQIRRGVTSVHTLPGEVRDRWRR